MTVRIRLFAVLRERAGSETIDLELSDEATVGDALRALDRSGPLAGLIARLPVRMAVNREYATESTPLAANDEIALIPPLSGGAQAIDSRVHVSISEQELSIDAALEKAGSAKAGAIVVFCGVTREVERLEYEAYAEMAQEQIARIAAECLQRHKLTGAVIEHRIGSVPLGKPSVVVAASAPHREQAFAGAREMIDRVKEQAPIWKREVAGSAGSWVQGAPPA